LEQKSEDIPEKEGGKIVTVAGIEKPTRTVVRKAFDASWRPRTAPFVKSFSSAEKNPIFSAGKSVHKIQE